jgi:hypothetical protein
MNVHSAYTISILEKEIIIKSARMDVNAKETLFKITIILEVTSSYT